MHVLVVGASGFVGSKLSQQLMMDGQLDGETITVLTLVDARKPEITIPSPHTNKIEQVQQLELDISDSHQHIERLLFEGPVPPPKIIFLLAAIVSGDAEQNFELGYKVNVEGTKILLEAIRSKSNYKPRLVFTSSLAVYGTPLPDIIPDDCATTPRGSYGTQKAIVELYLEDYTRKGFVDAISIRYPTIAIRPGKPNKAASSFISGIIREPLNGQQAILPVDMDFRHTIASPQKAVEYALKAATLKPARPGDRVFNVPGVCVTVREMIAALERATNKQTVALIQHQEDPFILGIVKHWPKEFDCQKALRLGFQPDDSYDDILQVYMRDELGIHDAEHHKSKKQKVTWLK